MKTTVPPKQALLGSEGKLSALLPVLLGSGNIPVLIKVGIFSSKCHVPGIVITAHFLFFFFPEVSSPLTPSPDYPWESVQIYNFSLQCERIDVCKFIIKVNYKQATSCYLVSLSQLKALGKHLE